MAELGLRVQQQSDSLAVDGTGVVTGAGDRERALFTGDMQSKYRQWALAGRVFQGSSDTALGLTTVENNTALDATEPFILLDAPSSIILVPLYVKIAPAVIWETGDEVAVFTSDTAGYSAGGDDMTVTNMAAHSSVGSALRASVLTAAKDGDAAMTSVAATNPRTVDVHQHLTGNLAAPYVYNAINGDNPPVFIHGAGSFQVMLARTTTTVEVLYTVIWAELDKNALVNS